MTQTGETCRISPGFLSVSFRFNIPKSVDISLRERSRIALIKYGKPIDRLMSVMDPSFAQHDRADPSIAPNRTTTTSIGHDFAKLWPDFMVRFTLQLDLVLELKPRLELSLGLGLVSLA